MKMQEIPLILGRPFLATGGALINVELDELRFLFQDENVIFNVFQVKCHHNENTCCYQVDVVEDVDGQISPKETILLPIEYVMVKILLT